LEIHKDNDKNKILKEKKMFWKKDPKKALLMPTPKVC